MPLSFVRGSPAKRASQHRLPPAMTRSRSGPPTQRPPGSRSSSSSNQTPTPRQSNQSARFAEGRVEERPSVNGMPPKLPTISGSFVAENSLDGSVDVREWRSDPAHRSATLRPSRSIDVPRRPSTKLESRSTTTSEASTILTVVTRLSVTSVRWTTKSNALLAALQHGRTVYGIVSTPGERSSAANPHTGHTVNDVSHGHHSPAFRSRMAFHTIRVPHDGHLMVSKAHAATASTTKPPMASVPQRRCGTYGCQTVAQTSTIARPATENTANRSLPSLRILARNA